MEASPQRRRLLLLGRFVQTTEDKQLQVLEKTAIAVDDEGTIVGIETAARSGEGECEGEGGHEDTDEGDKEGEDAEEAAGQRLLGRLAWERTNVDEWRTQGGNEFFFPGFIGQYANVGLFGNSTLLDWLNHYTFPLEASLADAAKAKSMWRACVRRTLAHGTTTAAYYSVRDVAATNALVDECLAQGQRALVGRVCMDAPAATPSWYRDETPQEALAATLRTIEHARAVDAAGRLVEPVVTPRFAPACSSALMRLLGDLARRLALPVQTHVSETLDEIALVRRLFPDAAASYSHLYDSFGLLTPRTVLGHAIHLSADEARLIARRGSSVAHCPCSNSALASGRARVRWLWSHGIHVGLGTDMSGGYSPSVLEAARQALLVSRHLAMDAEQAARRRCPNGDSNDGDDDDDDDDANNDNNDNNNTAHANNAHNGTNDNPDEEPPNLSVDDVLFLATRGGAKALGLDHKIGAFAVGLQWDAQLIALGRHDDPSAPDHGNVDILGYETREEKVAKWLFNGDDRNTKKVWVQGRLVHSRS